MRPGSLTGRRIVEMRTGSDVMVEKELAQGPLFTLP